MKDIYCKYLSALRSFVQGTAPEKVDTAQFQALLELAKINSTGGIVCYAYMTHPEQTAQELLPLIRKLCYSEIGMFSRRAEQMKLLLQELEREAIDCILFKGFILRDYYPVPELRTFGDVDFVIRKEDRARCDTLMKSLDFASKDTWEPVYSYHRDTEYYEIHTDVMEIDVSDKADYAAYYSHIWEHVQPDQEHPHRFTFTPEFHFLYLLTHIAKHISGSGAGIRMYLDIAFFIRHFGNTLDWQWIAQELKVLQFEAFANMVLTAVQQWFGAASPLLLKPVAPQIQEDFLEFTLEGGIYGYVGRDKSVVFLKQQDRNEEDLSKFKTLMHHAFPPVKSMKNRYTYLQKHPWLLPAAWVHRLAASHKEWGRFADHTKQIITAEPEEVLKLKRIYKEIGL